MIRTSPLSLTFLRDTPGVSGQNVRATGEGA